MPLTQAAMTQCLHLGHVASNVTAGETHIPSYLWPVKCNIHQIHTVNMLTTFVCDYRQSTAVDT